jgi:hypothetical protein
VVAGDDARPREWSVSARPDFEPTVNEAEPPGFAIDGTDSFTVPAPGDGLPPEPEEPPAVSTSRLVVTTGALMAGLLLVVAVGGARGSGATDDALRTVDSPWAVRLDWWDDEPSGGGTGPIAPFDADTLALLAAADARSGGVDADDMTIDADDERARPTTPTTVRRPARPTTWTTTPRPATPRTLPTWRPYHPPRPPSTTRTTWTWPSTTSSTVAAPTTTGTTSTTVATSTTSSSTTTSSTTTSSSSTTSTTSTTTTTTPRPVPRWRAIDALPGAPCAAPRLFAAGADLVAATAAALHRRADATGWEVTVELPAGQVEVLAVRAGDGADELDAAALVDGALQRWDGTSWRAVPAPPGTAVPTSALFTGDALLVGTDQGVYLLADGADTWTPPVAPADEAVTADAWAGADGALHWRRADGDVLRRAPDGAWAVDDTDLPSGLTRITEGPDGALLGVRDGVLVAVTGATTAPFTPAPSLDPVGVVHSDRLGATFAWSADCAVQRLDAASTPPS